jgi:hypothetical protein
MSTIATARGRHTPSPKERAVRAVIAAAAVVCLVLVVVLVATSGGHATTHKTHITSGLAGGQYDGQAFAGKSIGAVP